MFEELHELLKFDSSSCRFQYIEVYFRSFVFWSQELWLQDYRPDTLLDLENSRL